MNLLEIREKILRKVSTIDNEKTLKIIDNLLDLLPSTHENVPSENLTEKQEKRLLAAYERRNVVEGKITHKEFMKKTRAWQEDLREEQILSLEIGIAQSENSDQCISHEEITAKYNNLYGS